MNKKSVWDFVKELLHEQDCVIVPGFGGFVCNPERARIDQVSHLITPPSKHVVFNQNLKTNDGLLASRISEQLKINYSEALRMIDETVNKTKDLLQEKKLLVVEFFGSFRLNADANYVFLPDKQNNFLYASFGLMPLQAEPVAGRSIKTRKVRVFKDRKEVGGAKNNKRRKNTLKIISGALALILGVNLFVFIKDPDLKIGGAKMNIAAWFDSLFHSQPLIAVKTDTSETHVSVKEETYIPPPPTPVESMPSAADSSNGATAGISEPQHAQASFDLLAFAEHIAAAKANTVIPSTIQEPVITEPAIVEAYPDHGKQPPVTVRQPSKKIVAETGDSSFYIIGGVFCKEKNAKRFFHQLEEKGFYPEIILNTRMNCNRVSYAKFSSRKEAERQLRSIHAGTNPEAWVFVQRN